MLARIAHNLLTSPTKRRPFCRSTSSMPSPIVATSTELRSWLANRARITVTLPKPMTSGAKSEGRFGKQDFVYLPEEDVYRCPAGERLTVHYVNEENGQKLRRYWTNACGTCAIKHRCTTGKERRITRWEHEHVLEAAQRRLDEPASDAPAPRDSRASVRYAQDANGRDALPDEAVAEGRHRNGAARACLQPHARDEHRRRETAPGGDPNVRCGSPRKLQLTQ